MSPLSRISAGSFFSGLIFDIFIVGLARHHGRRHEFDLVDQPKLDRGNADLAGKGRGGREDEFHLLVLEILFAVMAGLDPAIHGFS